MPDETSVYIDPARTSNRPVNASSITLLRLSLAAAHLDPTRSWSQQSSVVQVSDRRAALAETED